MGNAAQYTGHAGSRFLIGLSSKIQSTGAKQPDQKTPRAARQSLVSVQSLAWHAQICWIRPFFEEANIISEKGCVVVSVALRALVVRPKPCADLMFCTCYINTSPSGRGSHLLAMLAHPSSSACLRRCRARLQSSPTRTRQEQQGKV